MDTLAKADSDPKQKRVDVAKKPGLSASMIDVIIGKMKEIKANTPPLDSQTKKARTAKPINLDAAVFAWFQKARAPIINSDGGILRQKALEIATCPGIDSPKWLDYEI